ncbi:MAG TPA: hypothetical protein VL947_12660, partial [Cytophagales bacterium]|nr:hypothetical protein [Cytophagales bacterium]
VYDGGIHLAASFYALGGIFVLWRYLPPLWDVLVRKKDATPVIYEYPFNKPWQKYSRIAFKVFIFAFSFVISGYLHWYNYKHDPYKVPSRPGLADTKGFWNVSEFKRNGQPIPYAPVDSVRWRDVTFEKWSTISFTVANTFNIHGEAGRGKQFKDVDRTYESAGTGGGRRHFYYEADADKGTIKLFNKNKVYKDQVLNFTYERPSKYRIILQGKNEYNDEVYIVLDKIEKRYPLLDEAQALQGLR